MTLHCPHLVIFDCDGVIIDSEAIASAVVSAHAREAGWMLAPEDAFRRFVGLRMDAIEDEFRRDNGRAAPEGWRLSLARRLTSRLQDDAILIDGAVAALDAVTRHGIPFRIASNSSHAEMRAKFGKTGLAARLSGLVHSAEDVASGKPAPDVFLAASAASGIDPDRCWVIEDSVPGTRAGVAAGMVVIGYAPGGDGRALRDAGATMVIGALGELDMLLERACGDAGGGKDMMR